MEILTIFADISEGDDALQLLRAGVAPHQVVLPAKVAPSVLAESNPDPAFADADIVFGQPGVEEVLHASRLRWLHVSSAGYTRYDTPEFRRTAQERKLVVTNSSTVYAEPCAEHVFSFMLAHTRQLPAALKTGIDSGSLAWHQLRSSCALLKGQSIVILGFGNIARHLVGLLSPFGMQITAVRRLPKGDEEVSTITSNQLLLALATADHVVNLLPANPGSSRFVSAPQFASMKQGAVFYNIGRGATVDHDALLKALRSGQLAAAWLDVTDPEPLPPNHPLLTMPNCFITPHIAGGHKNESEMLVRHFLENFRHFLGNTPLLDRII
jgi:phosphoglycerate dehydrogenase-like enzyme